jgi:hypothetical protein
MPRLGLAVPIALAALLVTGGGGRTRGRDILRSAGPVPSSPDGRAEALAPRVQIEMRNVHLHIADGVILDVSRLRGEMISRSNGPPIFDDGESYVLAVDEGRMTLDMASLTRLLNDRVLAAANAPLKRVSVRATEDGKLQQKGRLHKGIDLPFSMTASVSAAADGALRLHLESMKLAGVPVKSLMRVFGLELDDVVRLEQGHGVSVRENDVTIDIGQVLPAPQIRGRLADVRVQGDRLVQTFARADRRHPRTLAPPDDRAQNYVYFSGGTIRFGKLTMTDADLQLIDADPRDHFDFFPARYKSQLVAGYSKNTPAGGLETYMPDFNDLGRSGFKDLRPSRPSR